MPPWRRRLAQRPRNVALLGILCILLLLFGLAVQAVHTHQDGAIHSDCALCVTPPAVLAAIDCATLLLIFECVLACFAEEKKIYLCSPLPFALFNRPPPHPTAVS
jgi:hypothetical protein